MAAHTSRPTSPRAGTDRRRRVVSPFVVLAALAMALVGPMVSAPAASADDCPDVQVVYARGTFEPPGVGATGQAFVDALRADLPNESLDVYAVDYPASLDFARAADGVVDASNKVQDVVNRCPKTKLVLSGYSQGAAVIAYITTDSVPSDYALPAGITGPMPASVARNVSAVALFGKPSSGFMSIVDRNAPPITVGGAYAPKTIDLCIPDDPVCSPGGRATGVHSQYAVNGMTGEAATFAAKRVLGS